MNVFKKFVELKAIKLYYAGEKMDVYLFVNIHPSVMLYGVANV